MSLTRFERWRFGGEPYVDRRPYTLWGIVTATTPRTVSLTTATRPIWYAANYTGPRPKVGDRIVVTVGRDGDIHGIAIEPPWDPEAEGEDIPFDIP